LPRHGLRSTPPTSRYRGTESGFCWKNSTSGRVFDRTGTLDEVSEGYRLMNDRDVLKFQIAF
jgi:hypothetical protein